MTTTNDRTRSRSRGRGRAELKRRTRGRRGPLRYPPTTYRRPRYTEVALSTEVSSGELLHILNMNKDATRIAKLRNRDEPQPPFIYRVLRNDDSVVVEHELWQLAIGERLPGGSYRLDAKSAAVLLELAGERTEGMSGTDLLERVAKLAALYAAAVASR
jgi:hypothetical protein